MIRSTQLVAVAAITLIGAAGGLLLTRSMGGRAASDVCRGAGTLEATSSVAVTPSAANGFASTETFYTCHRLGFRVVFNARTGEAVSQTPLDQEVVDYYKAHPEQNPMTIANKTADAASAVNAFTTPIVPTPLPGAACFPGSTRTLYPQIAASLCVPTAWVIKTDNTAGLQVAAADGLVAVGVFVVGVTGTAGTKCASPTFVKLPAGEAKVCAFNPDPWGGQGHGVVLPGGRELGVLISKGASEEARALAFQVAFSVTPR